MTAGELFALIIAILLLATPFALAYGIWILIGPLAVLEKLLTIIIIAFIAFPVGFLTWIFGFAILNEIFF